MICLVFPGQGSQSNGMGIELAERFPSIKKIIEIARNKSGIDFFNVVNSDEKLAQTEYSQLVIYMLSCALYEILDIKKMRVSLLAGHSLGEFSAVYASGAITFEYGLELVQKRAQLMESAAIKNQGAMAAVLGLSQDEVEKVLKEISDLFIANINSQNQIVVSGTSESIEKCKELFTNAGAKRFVKLNVNGAFHSSFMSEPALEFGKYIENENITSPRVPVLSNINTKPLANKKEIEEELSNQMCSKVNWLGCVLRAKEMGVKTFVEVGPGNVLSNLIKRIEPSLKTFNMNTVDNIAQMPKEWIIE